VAQNREVLKMSNWQTNLRRSTGAPQQIGAVRKNLRKSDVTGQVSKSKNENTSKAAIKPRLKSVTETDDVFGDENEGNKIKIVPRENRKRLSTKGSVSEVEESQKPVVKPKVAKEQKTPVKITKAFNFLRPIAPFNASNDEYEVKNIPSPIPLPKGVTNIDPYDDSCQIYGKDIFNYVLARDAKLVRTSKDFKGDSKILDRREHLIDWLTTVAHHHKTSQETFYHTVDILDRCLSKVAFKPEYLQLLGITSFLIATKIDEYHPANIEDLCQLTEDTCTRDKVLSMEHKILEVINFETYGTEPMTFIRRYLKAAQLSTTEKTSTYELSILFMDAMVLKLWDDEQDALTSKKAAVAVFTALMLTRFDVDFDRIIENVWTPNMIHYVWPNYRDLLPMSRCMLKILTSLMTDSKNDFALTAKYKSVSRHAGLLQKLSIDYVIDVESFIETL